MSSPAYLQSLNKDLIKTEKEIKQQEKLRIKLKNAQIKREKRIAALLIDHDPDAAAKVEDAM